MTVPSLSPDRPRLPAGQPSLHPTGNPPNPLSGHDLPCIDTGVHIEQLGELRVSHRLNRDQFTTPESILEVWPDLLAEVPRRQTHIPLDAHGHTFTICPKIE